MSNEKKKLKKIGRPNPFLYWAAGIIMYPIYKIKYGLKIDKSGIKGIKGPAILLSQHLSGKDHVLTGLTLFPKRPTFVASEHFIMNPLMKKVFKWMHIITKKMFAIDVGAILNMKRAKDEKNIIVLFPEGRLPANGQSVPVTAGTALLIKKLGINVYFMRSEGAYHAFPKWGKFKRSGGRIHIKTAHILTPEEIEKMSVVEIEDKLQRTFVYNENDLTDIPKYFTADTTAGLDGILWQCPVCLKNHTIKTGGGKITCECSLNATLSADYTLEGTPFNDLGEWYEWQARNLVLDNPSLVSKVTLGTPGPDGQLNPNAGEGIAVLDKDVYTLDGTLNGEKIHLSYRTSDLGGFPVTVADHYDVYDHGKLIYVYPPDRRDAIQWVAYLDQVKKNKR